MIISCTSIQLLLMQAAQMGREYLLTVAGNCKHQNTSWFRKCAFSTLSAGAEFRSDLL